MKKLLLSLFILTFFTTTFAAPKRYKLLTSTSNWFTATWSQVGAPSNGDTVTIPANMQLILSSDLTLQDVYFDIYGGLVLANNTVNVALQNSSTVNIHTSGWIGGFFASQQIALGSNSIFNGTQFLLLGPRMATNTTNGFVPYIEPQTLPVTFIAFNVARSNNAFLLSWATEETRVAHYDVQRSEDGATWKTIATVPAVGNATHTYRFVDNRVAASTIHYRIREVDADGIINYSAVRMFKGTATANATITEQNSKILVRLAQPANGPVTVEVIGLNGYVATKQIINQPTSTLQVTTVGLRGVYIVRVSNGHELNTAQQLFL